MYDTNKYGSAVIYAMYFTLEWSMTQTNNHGSAVIYAVYFTVAWLTTQTNIEVLVSFLDFTVVACAWSMTRKFRGQLASVELT